MTPSHPKKPSTGIYSFFEKVFLIWRVLFVFTRARAPRENLESWILMDHRATKTKRTRVRTRTKRVTRGNFRTKIWDISSTPDILRVFNDVSLNFSGNDSMSRSRGTRVKVINLSFIDDFYEELYTLRGVGDFPGDGFSKFRASSSVKTWN